MAVRTPHMAGLQWLAGRLLGEGTLARGYYLTRLSEPCLSIGLLLFMSTHMPMRLEQRFSSDHFAYLLHLLSELRGAGGSFGAVCSDTERNCIAGLSIINFSSETAALSISNGATVNLEGRNILRNTISDTHMNSAVISVNAVNPDSDYAQQQNTILKLRHCWLSQNSGPETILAHSSDCSPSST